MKERMKIFRGSCIVLFMLMLGIFIWYPVSVKAEEQNDVQTIQCGDDVYGTLDSTGTLTISGTGDMWDMNESCFKKIHSDVYQVVIEDGVTSVGDGAFLKTRSSNYISGFANLKKVSIGKDVKSIGDTAFIKATSLDCIDIPESVLTIGECAFMGSGLTKCTLHTGLQVIGESAFKDTKLTSVNIPEGVSSIEEMAFFTESLTNVTIPHDITIIKVNAFRTVNAVIYSKDVLIADGAFGNGSVLKADRGSSAEAYVKTNNAKIQYFQYSVTVNFNAQKGSISTKSKKVLSEAYYGKLPSAKRKGYLFEGWYTKESGGTKITADTLVTTQENITLYAHWTKVQVGKCKKPTVSELSASKIKVTAGKIYGAIGYQIRYAQNTNMSLAKVVYSTSTIKTIKNLKKGKKYYIQVRAYKKDSTGAKVYGKWSVIKSIKKR